MGSVAIDALALAARFLTQVASLASRHGQYTVRAAFFLSLTDSAPNPTIFVLQSYRRTWRAWRFPLGSRYTALLKPIPRVAPPRELAFLGGTPRAKGLHRCIYYERAIGSGNATNFGMPGDRDVDSGSVCAVGYRPRCSRVPSGGARARSEATCASFRQAAGGAHVPVPLAKEGI